MNELTISLNPSARTPLYEQIYRYIREEIEKGRITQGEKLPSTRALSASLAVSRGTAELAYEQLSAEGYIEAVPYRGYFVSAMEGLYLSQDGVAPNEPGTVRRTELQTYRYDFSSYGIDLESFPSALWQRLTRDVLLGKKQELFRLGPEQGEWELRKSIAGYLYHARGILTDPDHIVIGAGNDYLLMLVTALLRKVLPDGFSAAMERPTYVRAYNLFSSLGIPVVTVGMDENGIQVAELERAKANVAYLMPSHHFPMGTVTSIGRRTEILKWASQKEGRYLIEDDYDSEFRYRGRPIPALRGNDRDGRVIYLGTFSKSVAPAIRISYMVLPDNLLSGFQNGIGQVHSTVSTIDQRIMTMFIDGGHFERHLNKMRAIYKNKRDALVQALKECEIPGEISGDSAGLHLLLNLGNVSEERAIRLARQEGVCIHGLSEHFIDGAPKGYGAVILLGYACLSIPEIREGIRLLSKAWKDL